jgi:predicted dinucleotide-binding enzyme
VTTPGHVAVIGGGRVGATLARRLAAGGVAVTMGTRDPGRRPGGWEGAVASVADAIEAADAVVVAVPGGAVPAVAAEHGARLSGRIVLDATNDMARGSGGPLHHRPEWDADAPGAHVFRAFCTLGWDTMADPDLGDGVADILYSGPGGAPDATARAVIAATGMRPVRVGGPEADDLVDGATRLWFALATGDGGRRRLALRVLTDDGRDG